MDKQGSTVQPFSCWWLLTYENKVGPRIHQQKPLIAKPRAARGGDKGTRGTASVQPSQQRRVTEDEESNNPKPQRHTRQPFPVISSICNKIFMLCKPSYFLPVTVTKWRRSLYLDMANIPVVRACFIARIPAALVYESSGHC